MKTTKNILTAIATAPVQLLITVMTFAVLMLSLLIFALGRMVEAAGPGKSHRTLSRRYVIVTMPIRRTAPARTGGSKMFTNRNEDERILNGKKGS